MERRKSPGRCSDGQQTSIPEMKDGVEYVHITDARFSLGAITGKSTVCGQCLGEAAARVIVLIVAGEVVIGEDDSSAVVLRDRSDSKLGSGDAAFRIVEKAGGGAETLLQRWSGAVAGAGNETSSAEAYPR